jgi:hypothetical protein
LVKLGNLAQVDICLDGSAVLGSTDDGSLALCSLSKESRSVPEPGTIFGLGIISAYMIFLRGKLSNSRKTSIF